MGKRRRTQPGDWPRFEDRFLRTVLDGFRGRRKALRYKGCEFVFSNAPERFEVTCAERVCLVALELDRGNRGRLYVRSNETASYGRILIRCEYLRLVTAPAQIVVAFEATLTECCYHRITAEVAPRLLRIWNPLTLRLV